MARKKPKRKGRGSHKGSAYERGVCKELSLWWTGGDRDDVFWRSSTSGGRAKARARRGKDTFGHHGDIAATDPIGIPFINVVTCEFKRGYNRDTFVDILDRSPSGGIQQWERWVEEVYEAHTQAQSFAWLILQRRDQRQPFVYFPKYLLDELREQGAFPRRPHPLVQFAVTAYIPKPTRFCVVGMHWRAFLTMSRPHHFTSIEEVSYG